ncbi:hypothetical protein EGJ27_12350 [Pseudomonas sp. v388]|uniref:DUF6152 family protein n=1 Tax=Pseudomonas sp. v388 TaxID=2479849 RepID=UPI000F78D43A|nr:DUF6152 family protein [Pseudomonas sp. v388]RRV07462.1 hypothetical protein EGJ27_12350 [Pseudomonas sp. v388]
MKSMIRCIGLSSLLIASAAFAHHGWSEYDTGNVLNLNGTIEESSYANPHGEIRLRTKNKTWTVVLAPPSRMENRGLTKDMLAVGNDAEVTGYPNRNKPEELRAERIIIAGKTVELR